MYVNFSFLRNYSNFLFRLLFEGIIFPSKFPWKSCLKIIVESSYSCHSSDTTLLLYAALLPILPSSSRIPFQIHLHFSARSTDLFSSVLNIVYFCLFWSFILCCLFQALFFLIICLVLSVPSIVCFHHLSFFRRLFQTFFFFFPIICLFCFELRLEKMFQFIFRPQPLDV